MAVLHQWESIYRRDGVPSGMQCDWLAFKDDHLMKFTFLSPKAALWQVGKQEKRPHKAFVIVIV